MNKKTDKKLKGIFVGIGLPVISGTILMLIDPIRIFLFSFSKSIWIWLLAKFESFTVYLGTNHEINGAVLIVLLIIVFVFMILVLLIIRESIESKTYTKYTEDEFFNVIWRWTWSRHKIINLWCFCKSCDLELSYDDSSTSRNWLDESPHIELICDHCHKTVSSIKDHNKNYLLSIVEREIKRKIRQNLHLENNMKQNI